MRGSVPAPFRGLVYALTSETSLRRTELFASLDALRHDLALQHDKKENILSKSINGVKFLSIFGVSLILAITVILCSPLRLLHPLLRRCGVRNGDLPVDVIARLYAHAIVILIGIEVHVEGMENIDAGRDIAEGGAVCMFSHASNLDPFLVAASQPLACKWVGKKDLFMTPIIGWMALSLGYIPINRKNREKAIESLHDAGHRIKDFGRIIAISPEGTRSRTGQLADFKKGPFHLQEQTQVAVLPCTIQGAYELWPPKSLFPHCGQVTVKFLPPMKPDKDRSRAETAKQVRLTMLEALKTAPPGTGEDLPWGQWIKLQLKRIVVLLIVWFLYTNMKNFLGTFTTASLVKAGVAITAGMTGAASYF